jgi:hypothetical protein
MHIIIIKLIFMLLMRVYTQLESAPFVLDLPCFTISQRISFYKVAQFARI